MNILFMGTPEFAVCCLDAVCREFRADRISVVTAPDSAQGRRYRLQMPPVKRYALEKGLAVYQPQTLKKEEFEALLCRLAPDIILVSAYGRLLPEYVLRYPVYGCINVHGSLLPEYRGAAPINRAIMDGKRTTGITTMYMEKGLDTGDMLLREEVEIGENETFGELYARLSEIGGRLIVRTVRELIAGKIVPQKQDDGCSSYARKIDACTQRIDWNRTQACVVNQINGLSPSPAAVTALNGKTLKLYRAERGARYPEGSHVCGSVLSLDGKIEIAARDGGVILRELQLEGGKRIGWRDFLNGRKIAPEDRLQSLSAEKGEGEE